MNNPYQPPEVPIRTSQSSGKITITDIDIPFGRLVVIMLKMMLASIPAVLAIYAVFGIIMLIVLLVFGGIGALSGAFSPSKVQMLQKN